MRVPMQRTYFAVCLSSNFVIKENRPCYFLIEVRPLAFKTIELEPQEQSYAYPNFAIFSQSNFSPEQ